MGQRGFHALMPAGPSTDVQPGNQEKPKAPKRKPDAQKVVAGKIAMVSTKVSEIMTWTAKVKDASTVLLASSFIYIYIHMRVTSFFVSKVFLRQ